LSLSAWDPRIRDRVDVAVFAASGEEVRPVLLVECKAPEVALDDAVVAQVRRYLRLLPARWIAVTNGRQFLTWRLREGSWEAAALPVWSEMKIET
jgi:Type I restriction enzyme R protein N terminus (HSDR_N)